MSDEAELTEEEKAMLAAADAIATEPVDLSDRGQEEGAVLIAPIAETAPVEIEATPEPEAPASKPRKAKAKAVSMPVSDVAEEATVDTWDGVNINPEIPAQMQYEQGPWGLLPVQMRHDQDGNPVR